MAVRFSSNSQPFLTKLDPQDIERREQDLKDVDIIYLHVHKGESGENNTETIGNILVGLQKVEHTVKEFNDVEECFTHIDERPHAKIYLILSSGLNENKMLILKEYYQVHSIYQFDSLYPWIKDDSVLVNSESAATLFNHLNARHRLFHTNIASENSIEFLPQNNINTVPSTTLITDTRLFVKYQLLLEILLRLPDTRESKEDFIVWCLEKYSSEQKDVEAINKFNTSFTPDQAIKCYTKPSFVYRILGLTFASDDFRLIYKIRYFIHHLYVELKDLHERTFAEMGSQIVVYRGKKMALIQFNRLKANIGKLVITKCFVSASLDRAVARQFSGDTEITAGNVAVIFHMKIDKIENKAKAFAFIGERSNIPDEDEFLLGPGIVFRNKGISKDEENMFIIELEHTSEEDEIEERIIRANTDYLEGAQNIESSDDFGSFIADILNPLNEQVTPQPSTIQDGEQNVLNPLNEQVTPQPSTIQDGEQNDRSIEPQSLPTIQQQTTVQMNENLLQRNSSAEVASPRLFKRLWLEIHRLRYSDICTGPSINFIIDQAPLDEEDIPQMESFIIIGRILPDSSIYNERAYKIEISFPPSYPFSPPVVRFLTPIYHPNVDGSGFMCLDILRRNGSWTSTTSLCSVLKAVTDTINYPDINTAVNIIAAHEYVENRAEFERKALKMAREHGLPRR